MPQQLDATTRNLADRWHALTQARLDYLTDLYESGRWRRFFSETDFLENFQETKIASETWRGLLTSEAPWNRSVVAPSSLDRPQPTPGRRLPNGWLRIVARSDERNDN
jgi:uncharacterized repeat protein (TIGR03809 family)